MSIHINPRRPINEHVARSAEGHHIRRMADRCHVGQSFMSVCRSVRAGFRRGAMRNQQPSVRRAIWHIVITQHIENRDLYRRVVSGRI